MQRQGTPSCGDPSTCRSCHVGSWMQCLHLPCPSTTLHKVTTESVPANTAQNIYTTLRSTGHLQNFRLSSTALVEEKCCSAGRLKGSSSFQPTLLQLGMRKSSALCIHRSNTGTSGMAICAQVIGLPLVQALRARPVPPCARPRSVIYEFLGHRIAKII